MSNMPSPTDLPSPFRPITLDLEAGTYFWCACQKSGHPPFCDGSHKGLGIQPLKFVLTEPKRVSLCHCKQTKNPPYCDGSHKGQV